MEKEKEENIWKNNTSCFVEKEKKENIMEKENCCGRDGRDIKGSKDSLVKRSSRT